MIKFRGCSKCDSRICKVCQGIETSDWRDKLCEDCKIKWNDGIKEIYEALIEDELEAKKQELSE